MEILNQMFILLLTASPIFSLTCIEKEGLLRYERTKTAWSYCVIAADAIDGPITLYGLGPDNDNTYVYDTLFGQSSTNGPITYTVLSGCVQENYHDSVRDTNEYKLRCFCNTNKCNDAKNITQFFMNLQ